MDKKEVSHTTFSWKNGNPSLIIEAVMRNGEMQHFEGVMGDEQIYISDYKFLIDLRNAINDFESQVNEYRMKNGRNLLKNSTPLQTPSTVGSNGVGTAG